MYLMSFTDFNGKIVVQLICMVYSGLKMLQKFDEKCPTDIDIENLKEYFNSMVFAIVPDISYSNTHPWKKKFSNISEENYEIDLKHLICHVQRHFLCGSH